MRLAQSKTLKPSQIVKVLGEEGFKVSVRGVQYLLKRYRDTGSVFDAVRPGRPLVFCENAHKLIDQLLVSNDEITTDYLRDELLLNNFRGSRSAVGRARIRLGWTNKATQYCQLIRATNQIKRVDFCKHLLETNETFDDVLFTDKAMVILNPCVQRSYHKKGQPRKFKLKPKYPTRVLVWGGISKRGATKAILFTGIMDAERYVSILERSLIPFVHDRFPGGNM